MKTTICTAILATAIAVWFVLPLGQVLAAAPEEDTLTQRVATMERLIANLQERVSKLEKADTGRAESGTIKVDDTAWMDKANWRQKLSKGMTKEEVRKLFGEPKSISTSDKIQIWSYAVSATITIDDAKGVVAWTEPR